MRHGIRRAWTQKPTPRDGRMQRGHPTQGNRKGVLGGSRVHSPCHSYVSIPGPRTRAGQKAMALQAAAEISIHGPRVGADLGAVELPDLVHDFNPRPPCGGRLSDPVTRVNFYYTISIHGPRVGADEGPARVAGTTHISIHGPRVGADEGRRRWTYRRRNFNPRPPCGGRPSLIAECRVKQRFQSTAPVWGPTSTATTAPAPPLFQSTAPVWGPTRRVLRGFQPGLYFNPRPPCGGRRF